MVDGADVGVPDAEGAAEGVAEASEAGVVDVEEEVSEECSGVAVDGAVDEAGSSGVLEPVGSCEGDVVESAAETVDGLAGELIPEARSTLIWSPQSKVFAFIRQLRCWPARLSGMGTCQAA